MATLWVNNDGGNDANGGTNATADALLTLEQALTNASGGDTIKMIGVGSSDDSGYTGDGIYGETTNYYDLPAKNLSVEASGTVTLTTNTTNPNIGVIWQNSTGVYTFTGFKIELLASATYYYMVRWNGAGSLSFINCSFDNKSQTLTNGVISGTNASTTRSLVLNNTSIKTNDGFGIDIINAASVSVSNGSSFDHTNGNQASNRIGGTVTAVSFTDTTFTKTGSVNRDEILTLNLTTPLSSNDTFVFSRNTVNCSHAVGGVGGKGIALDIVAGSGSGGSVTIADNTLTHTATDNGGILLQLGKDGPEDDADGNSTPLGPVTCSGNTITYGTGESHGLLIGFGCNNGEYTNNTIKGCDIGIVVKGTGNEIHHNFCNCNRALYFKSAQNSNVHHNSLMNLGGESIGFELQDANGAFTGDRRNPSTNNVHDNIFGNSGTEVVANRANADAVYGLKSKLNAYVIGSANWGDMSTNYATFAAYQSAYVATLGGDSTDNDSTSIQLTANPFVDPANDDWNLTYEAREILSRLGLTGIGAVAFGAFKRPTSGVGALVRTPMSGGTFVRVN